MWNCKHCKKNFRYTTISEKANHSRWCAENPKRKLYTKEGNPDLMKKLAEKKYGKFIIEKFSCERCQKTFSMRRREFCKLQRTRFCSRICANSCGGKARAEKYGLEGNYRDICYKHYPKECIICKFSEAVEVHHLDKNRANNSKENLVPLCPNHHVMIHKKKTSDMVEKQIKDILAGS